MGNSDRKGFQISRDAFLDYGIKVTHNGYDKVQKELDKAIVKLDSSVQEAQLLHLFSNPELPKSAQQLQSIEAVIVNKEDCDKLLREAKQILEIREKLIEKL